VSPVPGGSPHYTGLFEALSTGRVLGLRVPDEVEFVAVEAGDCLTVGGSMTMEIRDAVPRAVRRVLELLS
jgi:hypothetical protein